MDYRIISIGTLSRHPLWQDKTPPRTAHATTTLIRSDKQVLLVDPSLPGQILEARLAERAGLTLADVTDVFLTNFRPAHRRGLPALEHAKWWVSEAEREAVGVGLIGQLQEVGAEDEQTEQMLKQDIALLQRCKAAPDKLAGQVDLFPLPGFTPGNCGLLLTLARQATVLIAGDAVPTFGTPRARAWCCDRRVRP
jgi:glyoxylase-like metal-dependent hydrolase (beta-lactamase superfamily II)